MMLNLSTFFIFLTIFSLSLALRDNCGCAPNCTPDAEFNLEEKSVDPTINTLLNTMFPEGRRPDPSVLANSVDPNLYFTQEGTVEMTFYHEGAGYRNEVGYIVFNRNTREIIEETILFKDLSFYWPGCHESGDTVTFGPFPAGTAVGFFIRANGYNGGNRKYYSHDDSQNPDNKRHVGTIWHSNSETLLVGFEDLFNLGDHDYNDAMFSAKITGGGAIETEDLPTLVGDKLALCDGVVAPTDYISYRGYKYAIIDGTSPEETSMGCQEKFYNIPEGWELAELTHAAESAAARFPWGTPCLMFANGATRDTVTLEECAGGDYDLAATESDTCFSTSACDSRLVIQQKIDYTTVEPSGCFIDEMAVTGDATAADWTTVGTSCSGKKRCIDLDSVGVSITGLRWILTDRDIIKDGISFGMFAEATNAFDISGGALEFEHYFSVFADVFYTDGSADYGLYSPFPQGESVSRTYRRVSVWPRPGKTVKEIYLYGMVDKMVGEICFSDPHISAPDHNVLRNPSCGWGIPIIKEWEAGSQYEWYSLSDTTDSFQTSNVEWHELEDRADKYQHKSSFEMSCSNSGECNEGAQQFYDIPSNVRSNIQAFRLTGWSKAEEVVNSVAKNYGVIVDMEYTDGDRDVRVAPFSEGTHDWERTQLLVPCRKTPARVTVTLVFRTATGRCWFDNIHLEPLDRVGRPVDLGLAYGDPHHTTFDGLAYDNQAVGEFILARDTSNEDVFEIQVRTEAAGDLASVVTAVAIRHGCTYIELSAASGTNYPTLKIHGGKISLGKIKHSLRVASPCPDDGFPDDGSLRTFGTVGASSTNQRYKMLFNFPGTGYEFEIIVDVSVYNVQFFEVGVNLPRSAAGKMEGLLGNNDDNPNNDLKTRDGTVLDVNANDQDALYNQFIESWRVVADDAASKKRDEKDAGASNSLFLYNKGKTTETYTDRAHHENFLAVTSKPLSQTFGAAKVSEAEQACADAGLVNDKKNNKQDLDNCVLDALVLEDVDIATRSAGSAEVRKGNVPRIEGDFDEGRKSGAAGKASVAFTALFAAIFVLLF